MKVKRLPRLLVAAMMSLMPMTASFVTASPAHAYTVTCTFLGETGDGYDMMGCEDDDTPPDIWFEYW